MEAKSEKADVPNQHITPMASVKSSVKMSAEDSPLSEPASTRFVISIDIPITKLTADIINVSVRLNGSVNPDSELHSSTDIPSQAAPSPATPVSSCGPSQASAETPIEIPVPAGPCPCAARKTGDTATWRKKARNTFPRLPYQQNFTPFSYGGDSGPFITM